MEQADLAYIQDTKHKIALSPECLDNRDNGKPTNVLSNSILEKAVLETVVAILDKSTN
ncbi:hypothetical protein [Pseudoalteromonas mariniglutinosa]|uniref:hypothetical protein n=1 Tax=Pseudoalteromonas mariniglutinosa TaxID=206042 RepID=UPI00384A4D5A